MAFSVAQAPREIAAHPLALAAVLLLAATVRLWGLDAYSLWLDENATVVLTQQLAGLWGRDIHPPLYYGLVTVWRWLGDSEFVLRLSSVLPSLATVWLLWRCGQVVGGATAGLIAGLLQALSPFSVTYAQELRMYALLEFAVALALLGLLCLLRDPALAAGAARRGAPKPEPAGRDLRRAWWLYGIGTTLVLYTHNLGFLWPLVANLAVLAIWPWRPERGALARRWLLVNLAVLALWMPYWPAMLAQAGELAGDFWVKQPRIGSALAELAQINTGLRPRFDLIEWLQIVPLLLLSLLGYAVIRPRALALLLLLAAVVPPVVEYVLGVFVQPVFLGRTLIWTGIPFVLALASALAWILRPRGGRVARLRLGVGCTLLLLMLPLRLLTVTQQYDRIGKADWRGLFAELAWEMGPTDRVVISPGYETQSYRVYATRQEREGRPKPPPGKGIYSQEALVSFARQGTAGQRLWVIRSLLFSTVVPEEKALFETELACLKPIRQIDVHLLEVTAYVADAACGAPS